MARSIWSGSLSFGLVNVPVKLYSATEQKDIQFHQFREGTGKRVRNMRVVEGTQEEVPYEDVVKGYELKDGKWVMLDKEELESVEPGRSRTIDIEDFVDLDDVDPVYFEKTYYLGPEPDSGADHSYALLLRAMNDTGKVGIARFVMRGKQYLAAIRPRGDVLALETMFFADEVRDPTKAIDHLPTDVDVSKRELEVARKLIDSLSTSWEPDRYEDTYRSRVMDLIKRKGKGEQIEIDEAPEPAPVLDLMAALEASLEERRGRKQGASGRGRHTARADGGRSSKRARHDDVTEELSKEELVERARAAGVRGRSKMSKPELVEAIREAS